MYPDCFAVDLSNVSFDRWTFRPPGKNAAYLIPVVVYKKMDRSVSYSGGLQKAVLPTEAHQARRAMLTPGVKMMGKAELSVL